MKLMQENDDLFKFQSFTVTDKCADGRFLC